MLFYNKILKKKRIYIMDYIFDFFKIILPTIIAGIFAIFNTRYNKNIPLEKFEIAYNRVYYPLYKLIVDSDANKDIDIIVEKSELYFLKYRKYIDISTIRLYELLQINDNNSKRKAIYQSFKYNIYDKNTYLRKRLGYLEPNYIQLYKYSTPSKQSVIRIMMELAFAYITILVATIPNLPNNYYNIVLLVFSILLVIIFIEIIICIIRTIYYKIRK